MVWTEDEKQVLEEYRSLIESDPKKAIDLIIKNHNGPEWRSSGRIIFSLLLILNAKLYLEPDDMAMDIEVQYSLDGGNNVYVLTYMELNEGEEDKDSLLREFGYELETFYGFSQILAERLKNLVV